MFAVRSALLKGGPLARTAAKGLPSAVQQRQMSAVAGQTNNLIACAVLCGGAMIGAAAVSYNMVVTDNAKYNARIAEVNAKAKQEWTPKPWPPMPVDEE